MKLIYQKVLAAEDCSFAFLEKRSLHFRGSYHFHPEFEITLITAGSGLRVVGDNISSYAPDDLVLLGSNLPHQYVSDQPSRGRQSHAFVIQFSEDFLGSALFQSPEFKPVSALLDKASRGLVFPGGIAGEAAHIIRQLSRSHGLPRLIALLELLQLLVSSPHKEICSAGYLPNANRHESQKISTALNYLHEHFERRITVDEVARLLNISRATCNRLFQKSLGNSFKSFLIRMRISHACKLFVETEKSVMDIAFECGFSNLSNFNRQFKQLKGQTPGEFRRQIRALPQPKPSSLATIAGDRRPNRSFRS
jgi:AraC-like DNA-binding protein